MDSDIAAAVAALAPALADRAAQVDETGEITKQTMADLVGTGIFRLLQPISHGGAEADPLRFFDAVRAVAAACGSTGWMTAALGLSPWHVALFDEQAQHEVWTADPDALICTSYAPVGNFTPVAGGYELTGHWRFASGCAHAGWALLGGTIVADNGQPVDMVSGLVPSTEFLIDKVWDAAGLRGAGSDDLSVEKVFVPEHRVLRFYDIAMRQSPGQRLNAGPLYRMPYGTMYNYTNTSPVVGMAQGCLEVFVERMRDTHRLSFGGGAVTAEQPTAAARASGEIDAAVLQMGRSLRDLYDCASRKEEIPLDLRLRARRDQSLGAERALKSIDLIFGATGGVLLRGRNPIERSWRDAHIAGIHASNDVGMALTLYGRGAFGLPVDDMLV
ncbi:3-hydroxy-9,10-secoandrosta-1,3,5(10)-triene-9,17-dione monooxygenase oxygenase subunit [Nocardia alni]|uniref:3-hydroxy-9,10-secoandrosta-1,3,5(10)-triene-9, 17-dione monooxygenase oxygenase subunit n=1 Tax=Nocardia alni TaxID=2815723 RepID=UPI001C244419|nr:3-hydroxy-9,10-secoandrosta-1,3,5(10)-triene-9,17-dione monooxygenase oxygenase subunit [Nocardia alni]